MQELALPNPDRDRQTLLHFHQNPIRSFLVELLHDRSVLLRGPRQMDDGGIRWYGC